MTTPAATDATSRLMSPMPLPTRTIAGVIIAVLAIVLMALFTYRALQSREVAAKRVTQTLQILEGLQSLHSSLKDAETGQRGFLLSNEERYLEPYVAARAAVPSEFTTLRKLMFDSGAEQLQRLETLERISTTKLEELDQTIQLSRAGEEAMAIAIVRSDRGKNAMDQVRSIIGEMKATEDGLLTARQQEWQDAVTLSSQGDVGRLDPVAAADRRSGGADVARLPDAADPELAAHRTHGPCGAAAGRAAARTTRREGPRLPRVISWRAGRRRVFQRCRQLPALRELCDRS